MLLLLALVGKLAFLNLKVLSPGRVSLLQWRSAEGWMLRGSLTHLEHVRSSPPHTDLARLAFDFAHSAPVIK